jgi:RNA polymerase sporulation-specific sigma factor
MFVGYFPEPLSMEEETLYFKRYLEGDQEAKDVLILHNLRLLVRIAKRDDDLIAIGVIGLMKAVNTFDYKRHVRFSTYAGKCIKNEIGMHLRSNKKTRRELYLDDPISIDEEDNSISLVDVLESRESQIFDQISLKMDIEQLYSKLAKLSPKERLLLYLDMGLWERALKCKKK